MARLALEEILKARELLRGVINPTPTHFSQTFSDLAGGPVFLKAECLQKNGCHKLRGAFYLCSRLAQERPGQGICTFSAGNWAQAAAYAGTRLGLEVTVVMPQGANPKKAEATRGYGGEVVLFGRDSTELYLKAEALAREKGARLINPLDCAELMIGLGSLGLEILEEVPGVEAIVVPVGGGGLIAGLASAVKQLSPGVKVYGVQPEGAQAMIRSLEAGRVVELDRVETIADGLAVKMPSQSTVEIIRETVDRVVPVSDGQIREAIFLLLERAKLVVEPAGAAALAAVLHRRIPELAGRRTAVLLSGGNIDFSLLAEIISSSSLGIDGL